MKTMMTFAAVALCGLTVLVAGCKEETEAEKAQKGIAAAASDLGKAVDKAAADAKKAAADAKKAADKAAADVKKAADSAKK